MKPAFNSTMGLCPLMYLTILRGILEARYQPGCVCQHNGTKNIPKRSYCNYNFKEVPRLSGLLVGLRELLSNYISARKETEEQCYNKETAGSNSGTITKLIRSSIEALEVV